MMITSTLRRTFTDRHGLSCKIIATREIEGKLYVCAKLCDADAWGTYEFDPSTDPEEIVECGNLMDKVTGRSVFTQYAPGHYITVKQFKEYRMT